MKKLNNHILNKLNIYAKKNTLLDIIKFEILIYRLNRNIKKVYFNIDEV